MPPTSRRAAPAPTGRPAPPAVPLAWSAVVGAAFGAFYLALAPPVPGNKDAAEFTLVLALGGVPHPTGYPLYTLLGHAFVLALHHLGATWGYASNAWSAVGGGVAMALHHRLATRVIPPRAGVGRLVRSLLALVATLLIGLAPFWLLDVMLAEVYSWHLAWVCGTCLVALGIVRALGGRERDGAGTVGNGRRPGAVAAGWGLLCGVGLAHHLTAVLFIVPLSLAIVVALVRARLWRAWLPAAALAAMMVPLTSYGFVGYRALHPAAFQWPLLQPSLASVLAHVSGADYRDLFGRFAPSDYQRVLFATFIHPILFPALAGLGWAAWRARGAAERTALGGLLAAALIQTLYGYGYGVSDPSSYFQPNVAVALLAVPLLGAGLLRPGRVAVVAMVAGALAGAGLVVLGAWWGRFGLLARQDMIAIERDVRSLWRSIPPGEGIVLWRDDMAPMLRGFQLLDGERTDLYAQDPNVLTWTGPRRGFESRFGFDPLAGLVPLTASRLALIPENISRQTPLPVYVFDPRQRSVRALAKGSPVAP